MSPRYLSQSFVCLLVLSFAVTPTAWAKVKDLPPVADAQVASGATVANSNFGTRTDFFIQSANSANSFGNERAWLKFDLNNQIPPSASVSRATLRIYTFQADTADDLTAEIAATSNDSWTETGITWNNQPAFGAALDNASMRAQRAFLWYEFDVTSEVQTQLSGDGVVSLVVKPEAEGDIQWRSYRFNSREFKRDGYSLGPRLRVEYTGSWPTANAINVIHTNDIHSRLTTHDYDFPDAPGESAGLEEAGGAAYLAAKIVELKKAKPQSLMLDAGDISEGNPLGDLRGNGGTIEYFQVLDAQLKALANNSSGRGVDAVVVGNHDVRERAMLDNMKDPDGDGIMNGWVGGVLNANRDPDDVPYLAVNVLNDGETKPTTPSAWPQQMPFRPYVIVDVGSTRVGVLGYLTDDSAILTSETINEIDVLEAAWKDKGNGVDYSQVVLIEDWVEHLRTIEGADVVILLSHIGHRRLNADGDFGSGDGNDELIGNDGAVEPPDLVVSGHWHTWANTAWQPNNLSYKTTNVEASSYSQYVGEVSLTPTGRYLSATKHAIRLADFSLPFADPEVNAAYTAMDSTLSALDGEYAGLTGPDCVIPAATVQAQIPGYIDGRPCPLAYVVGYSGDDLLLDKDKWFTLSEFPWSGDNTAGFWITDAMVNKVRALNLNGAGAARSNADLALQSGGGIRRDNGAGPITYLEIFETYPWDDDSMVRVQMTSAQLWEYIEGRFVGSSISADWRVAAEDGQITDISFDSDGDGSYETAVLETDTGTSWNVIISEYMYENDNWISETEGTNSAFTTIDPNPEFLATDGTTYPDHDLLIAAGRDPLPIRDSVVEYTAQFDSGNPMTVRQPRYLLNTEIAGEFEAVVTMAADFENQPYFEGVFVRLLAATPETLARRNLAGDPYGLTELVNADGSINDLHEFKETLWYRSHLGFPDGYLKNGQKVLLKGEFGFFEGNAQFVEQEGVQDAEEEFQLIGMDPTAAQPNYFGRASEIFVDYRENHFVRFYGRRSGDNTVTDATGSTVELYREGGFFNSVVLPGVNGDCIDVWGVQTERSDGGANRRFRYLMSNDAAELARLNPFTGTSCFPPISLVGNFTGAAEVGSTMTLVATAEDLNGVSASGTNSYFAAMDINGEGAASLQTLTFSGININGQNGLTFKGLFAEDDSSDGSEDWDANDFVHVDYQIDGNGYQNLLHFEGTGTNTEPQVDSDFDGVGDGAALTPTFTEFSAAINGTGSVLDLRITIRLEAGDEDVAFDDISVENGSGSALLTEDFETAAVSYTTSTPEFSDGSGDFFLRTDGSNLGGFVQYLGGGSSGTQLFGTVTQVEFFASTDGGQTFSSLGVDNDGADGFSISYTPTTAGDVQFYTVATDNDGLVEPSPVYADLRTSISGAPVQVPTMPWPLLVVLLLALTTVSSAGRPRTEA